MLAFSDSSFLILFDMRYGTRQGTHCHREPSRSVQTLVRIKEDASGERKEGRPA
jgi:hypothetical protein